MNVKKEKEYDQVDTEHDKLALTINRQRSPTLLNNLGPITPEQCYDRIKDAFLKLGFDFRNRTSKKEIKKQNLIDVVEKAFDVRMTLLQATEAMMHCSAKVKDEEGSK